MQNPAFPLMAAACLITGCGGGSVRQVDLGLRRADDFAATTTSPDAAAGRPVALLNGKAISWEQLRPRLLEAAGRDVLEDIALLYLLEQECQDRGIAITPADVEAETELLIDAWRAQGIAQTRGQAEALLQQIRAQRRLGTIRFNDLLRRNAILRALVRGQVVIDEAHLARMYDLQHGQQYQARLIIAESPQEAQLAINELNTGQPFVEVAARRSTDVSASRGGLIPPINPADATWPAGVRDAVATLAPGELSQPIAVDGGYAILRLEKVLPADQPPGGLAAVRPEMLRLERLRQERLLMDQLAAALRAEAKLVPLEPALQSR